MEQSVQERIRQRAYQLWDTSGRMNGQAEQHWRQRSVRFSRSAS